MEYQVETTPTTRMMSCDFRGFQSQEPQTLSNKEQKSVEKGSHEMTTYSSRENHENHYTLIQDFPPIESLNYSPSIQQRPHYALSPVSTTSKDFSCRYPLGPFTYGSSSAQGMQLSTNGVPTGSVDSPPNCDIWNGASHRDLLMPPIVSPASKPDNCVVVWCKDALKTTNTMPQNQPSVQLPRNTPHSEPTAQYQNRNLFENFASKMKIQRHVFHPNEALRLPGFEAHKGSTPTRNVNYGDTLSPVAQTGQNRFSSPLAAGAIDPNLSPYFPISALNMAAQFAPFPEPKFAPMMPWQCPPRQSLASQSGMFSSFLQAAMRPKTTPVGYTLDHVSSGQHPRGMGCQAPIPFVTRETTPQYPDVQYMFRAANLLMMPNQLPQEAKPVYEEVASKISHLPSAQEDATYQDQNNRELFKDPVSDKTLHQNKSSKSHRCNFCQKVYSRQSALKVHMRIHTGERPYSCTVCKRSFAQAGGLESHTRSHTGEKPFKCDVCDRRFSHSTAARNHKRIHTGEKPFKCEHEGCGKGFADQSTLKKHRRIHTGEKPFQCPHCFRKFTQLGNMNKHIRCKHNQGMKK